ncbi:hypothetical protein CspHIS471_0504430 [Cutaneotrichosporon sp. HIS471]|nr:hypothetical protein CspHIS471_0504430 [Cutaneotrichosporon sp. HIS471]
MAELERSLHETLVSGLGAEVTDRVVQSGSGRPLWLLKPLPLPAHSVQPRETSLVGMCSNIISANFDAFRPGDLRLPPLLFRKLMATVFHDRYYSADNTSPARPDQATMWAFMVIHDPDGAAQWAPSHTIALPAANTVHNLATSTTRLEDREHPLLEIPRIFKELNPDKFRLLTTLTLDYSVDDAGLQALRWADHLTVLWIRQGVISDDGIRMLAASLELPDWGEGRGCWRLRALYLPGCRRVGDRSMKSLARWPGLSVIDVRDTSCTEVALGVVNRSSAGYFEDQPPFQRCTDGLKDLFQIDQEEVLDNLVASLLKPDLPSEGSKDVKEEEGEERRHLALHVVPGPTPGPEHLHEALRSTWSSDLAPTHRGHFVTGGTGTVWGRNARMVNNHEVEKRRHAVEWALNFQSHEEAVDRALATGKRAPKSWWEKEREETNRGLREFRDGVKRAHGWKAMVATNHAAGRVYYPKKKEVEVVDGEVRGMPDLMMVRLVHPQWWELKYKRAEVVVQTNVRRTAVGRNEVADMLVSVDAPAKTQVQSQSSPPALQSPAQRRPWITRAAPASFAPPSQSHSQSQVKRNPFAAKSGRSSGIHQLGEAKEASQANSVGLDRGRHVVGPEKSVIGKKDPLLNKGKVEDPLAFLDKDGAKTKNVPARDLNEDDDSTRARRDPLSFVKTTSKDSASRPHIKPMSQPELKPQPAKPQPKSTTAKKRPAPTPAAAPPKRKLTDFFAPK